MVIVKEEYDILSEAEKSFLQKKCENFVATNKPFNNVGAVNYFYREFLDNDIEEVIGIRNKIEKYVIESLSDESLIIDEKIWINKIDTNSNKDDGLHYDKSLVSCVVYLNDDFEGGEFQYVDNDDKVVKIQPKKWKYVIMNNRVKHGVLPVESGVRYSLVFFFTKKHKNKKTII